MAFGGARLAGVTASNFRSLLTPLGKGVPTHGPPPSVVGAISRLRVGRATSCGTEMAINRTSSAVRCSIPRLSINRVPRTFTSSIIDCLGVAGTFLSSVVSSYTVGLALDAPAAVAVSATFAAKKGTALITKTFLVSVRGRIIT